MKKKLNLLKNKILENSDNITRTIGDILLFKKDPNILNSIKLGMSTLSSIQGFSKSQEASDYINTNNYVPLENVDGWSILLLLSSLEKIEKKVIETQYKYEELVLFDNTFLYVYSKEGSDRPRGLNIYVKAGTLEESEKKLIDIIVKDYPKEFIDININKETNAIQVKDYTIDLSHVKMKNVVDLNKKLSKYLSKNINRSILFNGVPGTGKTTICKALANSFNFRTVIIYPALINRLRANYVSSLLRFFKIECVIIDDIDKIGNEGSVLSLLEELKKSTKLVLGTSNRKEMLSSCTIRPGRFDEVIEYNNLDLDIVRDMLTGESEEVFEKMKEWPVAFIQEYLLRKSVLGTEDALASISDLVSRLGKNTVNKDGQSVKVFDPASIYGDDPDY